MKQVTVLAPAKLNLTLDVTGLLPGGYHALDMIMQTITLHERVVLRKSRDLILRLPGSRVPANEKNTAYKAALAFFHYTGLLAGVEIEIHKATPVRAGMAGGSADAAAVLVGMNELYGAKLSITELCAIGATIGADVPFAILGGTCRVQGIGDILKPLPPCPDCWFVVVMPSVGVSTPEAFARYDEVGSSVHPDSAAAEAAVKEGDLNALCAACGNALEECSGAKETPAIKRLLDDNGALASTARSIWPSRTAGAPGWCTAAAPATPGTEAEKRRNKNPGRRNKKQNARPCYWQKLPGKGRAFYVFACT